MKILVLTLFTTMCLSWPLNNSETLRPYGLRIIINDELEPLSFDVFWPKVENSDIEDPVVGYKVKVIEVKKIKKVVNKYNNETSTITPVDIEEYPKINIHKAPDGIVNELKAPASDNPQIRFDGLKLGVPYEITVTAYTKKIEGTPSLPSRLRVHDS